MHSFKSYSLLFFLFLLSSTLALARVCQVTVTPASPAPVCQGKVVTLTATPGTVTGNTPADYDYQWMKDNVDIPNATQQTFDATQTGNYLVKITSKPTAATLCTASSVPVVVTINPVPAAPNFVPNPSTSQCSGTAIQFKVISPAPNTSYVWDFGDGSTAVSETVTHAYQSIGGGSTSFNVKLFAQNDKGCRSDTTSQFIIVNQKPAFTAPKDSSNFIVCIAEGDTVKVKASLLNQTPVPNDITRYIVDFGNGEDPQEFLPSQFTSTIPIRNKVPYDTTGAFTISIRAMGANGCDSVFTRDFQINRDPEANFSADEKKRLTPTGCVPVIVMVKDSSKGGNLVYKYEVLTNQGQPAGGVTFINNTTNASKNPVLQFGIEGRYNIRLVVSNSCESDTTNQSILIARPEVQLFADSTSCGPATILFDASKVQYDLNLGLEEKNVLWTVAPSVGATFANGTTRNSKFPEITFTNPGEYKVSVIFENECGNSRDFEMQPAEATITINAVPGPVLFSPNSLEVCSGDSATLKPTSAGTQFIFYDQETGGTNLGTGAEYKTGPLNETTTFYAVAVNAKGCESAIRTAFTVSVVPDISNNIISLTPAQEEICAGQPFPGSIMGAVPTGGGGKAFVYTWQSSTTSASTGFRTASGTSTTLNLTPNPLANTTWFRRIVKTGNCSADTSNVVLVNVIPPITDNTITINGSAKALVCQGSNAPTIMGSPSGDFIVVWESSTVSATAGFAEIEASRGMANFTPGALTTTTWYRRKLSTVGGGCTNESEVVKIEVISPISANTIQANQTLCSSSETPATLTGSVPTGGGGTANRRIIWESSLTGNPNDFTAIANANTVNYTPAALSETTYFRRTVEVVEGDCEPSRSNVVVITIVPTVSNNTVSAAKSTICQGTSAVLNGSAATTGTRDEVEYRWESSTTSKDNGFNLAAGSSNMSQDYTPSVLAQSTWFRRGVRVLGTTCAYVYSTEIKIEVEKTPATPSVEATDVQTCPGVPVSLKVSSAVSGINYEWYTLEIGGNPVFTGAEFLTTPEESITYYVGAVSQAECRSIRRVPVRVAVIPVMAFAGRDTTIMQGQSIQLNATGGTTYEWTPSTGLSNPNIANPLASPEQTTTYTVTVMNGSECVDSDEITITVLPRLLIVNTFSPNNDGINEVWEIGNIENYPNATIEIINRYGAQVYKTQGYSQPWNGTHNGVALPLATYYYIIRLNPGATAITGSVTIIR